MHQMKDQEEGDFSVDLGNSSKERDFISEDLCLLKAMFLEIEKIIDTIEIRKKDEGETFPGAYVLELLSKAGVSNASTSF